MAKPIENDDCCFCCGMDNSEGLHLRFAYPQPGEAETELTVPERFSGWRSLTHGGFLSMLLDEAMAHACIRSGGEGPARNGVTAEMTVRFLKPVETGTQIRVVAKVAETKGRLLFTQGWIYAPDGTLLTEGKARFLSVNAE